MNEKLPDIGLTANGYVLDLMGQCNQFSGSQQLEIRSWSAPKRMAELVPAPWRADRWWRMKLRVDLQRETSATVAVVRGKAWPREEEEREHWTFTARDKSPYLNISPGLHGNAKDVEPYLDNIEVVANDAE
ncbi:MAG: hypothetical protein AAFU85_11700 [Planctomycetota bacterium]